MRPGAPCEVAVPILLDRLTEKRRYDLHDDLDLRLRLLFLESRIRIGRNKSLDEIGEHDFERSCGVLLGHVPVSDGLQRFFRFSTVALDFEIAEDVVGHHFEALTGHLDVFDGGQDIVARSTIGDGRSE